jgi:hypothetical protein
MGVVESGSWAGTKIEAESAPLHRQSPCKKVLSRSDERIVLAEGQGSRGRTAAEPAEREWSPAFVTAGSIGSWSL